MLPLGSVARSPGQYWQALLQAGQERRQWERADLRSGKLNGERKAIDTAANGGDYLGVVDAQGKIAPRRLRSRDEEPHRCLRGSRQLDWRGSGAG